MNFIQLQYQPELVLDLSDQPNIWQQINSQLDQLNSVNRLIYQQIKLMLAHQQADLDFEQLTDDVVQIIQMQTNLDEPVLHQLVTTIVQQWQRFLIGERKTAPTMPRALRLISADTDLYSCFATIVEQFIDWNLIERISKIAINQSLQQLQLTVQLTTARASNPVTVVANGEGQYWLIRPVRTQAPKLVQSLADVTAALYEYSPDIVLCDQLQVAQQLVASWKQSPILRYSQAGLRSTNFLNGESPIWQPADTPDVVNLDPEINEGYQLLRRYDIHCIQSIAPFAQLFNR